MKQIMEKLTVLKDWANRPHNKKRIFLAMVMLVGLWFVFRFVVVGMENRRFVFNPARSAVESGLIVDTQIVQKTTGALREPLTVKNNRAFVSGSRIGMLKSGQKIGNGTIVSVSNSIDLDTGMYRVATRGVADGLNYAEYKITGYFVPSYAIKQGNVYVINDDNTAVVRPVHIAASDSETSVITSGLNDGDIVILSKVSSGAKVQSKNN